MSGIIIIIIVVVVIDITVTEMLSDRSPDWIDDMWMNIYLVTVFTKYSRSWSSPVHYVQNKRFDQFFGDLLSYTFLESWEPTKPEKKMFKFFSKHSTAAILDFQNGDYLLLTFCNISASKHLRLLILVSNIHFQRQGI